MIRPARSDDLASLLTLLRSLRLIDPDFDPDFDPAPAFARLLASETTTVLVAQPASDLVATCTLAIIPNLTWSGRPFAVIENVATHPAHRRQGWGRAVLADATARAWSAGCHKVTLATGSRDPATIRFYEGAGFTPGTKTYFERRSSQA